jgi:hypothetical protein
MFIGFTLSTFIVYRQKIAVDNTSKVLKVTLTTGALGAGLWNLFTFLPPNEWTSVAIASAWAGATACLWQLDWPTLIMSKRIPAWSHVIRQLTPEYQKPVRRALFLYHQTKKQTPDYDTKKGLKEVAIWVFTLQKTVQRLNQKLSTIRSTAIRSRIQELNAQKSEDAFTNERQLATIEHLRMLLAHRQRIEIEVGRTHAMVGYAIAFLEEANASLTLAMTDPGSYVPERLPDVLFKLRTYASDQRVQKESTQEVAYMHHRSSTAMHLAKTQSEVASL